MYLKIRKIFFNHGGKKKKEAIHGIVAFFYIKTINLYTGRLHILII